MQFLINKYLAFPKLNANRTGRSFSSSQEACFARHSSDHSIFGCNVDPVCVLPRGSALLVPSSSSEDTFQMEAACPAGKDCPVSVVGRHDGWHDHGLSLLARVSHNRVPWQGRPRNDPIYHFWRRVRSIHEPQEKKAKGPSNDSWPDQSRYFDSRFDSGCDRLEGLYAVSFRTLTTDGGSGSRGQVRGQGSATNLKERGRNNFPK